MVKLSFEIEMPAPIGQVWKYFSKFENITQWDPNILACKVLKKFDGEIGTEYQLLSVFNGNKSKLVYKTHTYQEFKSIGLYAENEDISANDCIHFFDNRDGTTKVTYIADICLRGVKVLFTPFILSGLKEIAVQAEKGMLKKSAELFGRSKNRRNTTTL